MGGQTPVVLASRLLGREASAAERRGVEVAAKARDARRTPEGPEVRDAGAAADTVVGGDPGGGVPRAAGCWLMMVFAEIRFSLAVEGDMYEACNEERGLVPVAAVEVQETLVMVHDGGRGHVVGLVIMCVRVSGLLAVYCALCLPRWPRGAACTCLLPCGMT